MVNPPASICIHECNNGLLHGLCISGSVGNGSGILAHGLTTFNKMVDNTIHAVGRVSEKPRNKF